MSSPVDVSQSQLLLLSHLLPPPTPHPHPHLPPSLHQSVQLYCDAPSLKNLTSQDASVPVHQSSNGSAPRFRYLIQTLADVYVPTMVQDAMLFSSSTMTGASVCVSRSFQQAGEPGLMTPMGGAIHLMGGVIPHMGVAILSGLHLIPIRLIPIRLIPDALMVDLDPSDLEKVMILKHLVVDAPQETRLQLVSVHVARGSILAHASAFTEHKPTKLILR